MVNTSTAVTLGLVGGAAGAMLASFGITPDLMSDTLKDQIVALAGDHADKLSGAGIQVLNDPNAVNALAQSAHIIEHGDKIIAVAQDGLGAISTVGLSGNALEAAQAINAHFVDPSVLTQTIQDFAHVTPENAHAAVEAMGKVIGPEHAQSLIGSALSAGGNLAEATLSTIGSTPFEQSQFLSSAIPPAAGLAVGGALGLAARDEKPAIGPNTQKVLEQRQQALTQQLNPNSPQVG